VKRRFRLTRATDFKRVRRFGRAYAHPLIVLVTLPGEEMTVQVGIAASRSVGKAVDRNRAKRRIRAALEGVFSQIRPGWKIIILARKPIITVEFLEIKAALVKLLKEAGLLVEARNGCEARISE
jgi:ribonuclease P protein component